MESREHTKCSTTQTNSHDGTQQRTEVSDNTFFFLNQYNQQDK